MRNIFKKLELEWKIVIVASALFFAILLPTSMVYLDRMHTLLVQSIDPGLEPLLRSYQKASAAPADTMLIASIKRQRQWQAMLPVIMDEQQRTVQWFSVGLFVLFLGVAVYVLKRLTQPLKRLSRAAEHIGKGVPAPIAQSSGGALGKLEHAMATMQEELKAFREHAQVEGMEMAWRDIARVMAHEIKNPLTPIRLTLDRAMEKIESGETIGTPDLKKYFDRIGHQIEHLESLVNEFRSFTREPEVMFQAVALRPLIEGIGRDMSSGMTTSIRGEAEVNADPRLINQILMNLWNNSSEAGATTVCVSIQKSGDTVTITMVDNGSGIPPDLLDRVFVPYVTFKKGGTGLGLPIVKKLMESMHGTVALCAAQPEPGVTITLSFSAVPLRDTDVTEKRSHD